MSEQRRRILVRGRVQGVGFRYFAFDVALDLGLSGYVRNLPDGRTVEAVVQGTVENVERFTEALRKGPPGSFVAEFEETDEPPQPEPGRFVIAR